MPEKTDACAGLRSRLPPVYARPMSEQKKDQPIANQPQPEPPKRKPYVPPAVEESGEFQRLVLACARVPGPDPFCEEDPFS